MPVPVPPDFPPTPTPTPTPPPSDDQTIPWDDGEPIDGPVYGGEQGPWQSDPTDPIDPSTPIDPFDPIGDVFDSELQDFANQYQP